MYCKHNSAYSNIMFDGLYTTGGSRGAANMYFVGKFVPDIATNVFCHDIFRRVCNVRQ